MPSAAAERDYAAELAGERDRWRADALRWRARADWLEVNLAQARAALDLISAHAAAIVVETGAPQP